MFAGGWLEDERRRRRRPPLLAGDRADQARHVLAHAEALVADPVALAEILAAAGAGERDRAEQQREAELRRESCRRPASPPGSARHVSAWIANTSAEHDERDDQRHLDEDQPLERDVDDGRQRQRRRR